MSIGAAVVVWWLGRAGGGLRPALPCARCVVTSPLLLWECSRCSALAWPEPWSEPAAPLPLPLCARRDEVLPKGVPKVSVEAGSTFGWGKYVGESGICIGVDEFGASAPAPVLYEKYGITVRGCAASGGGRMRLCIQPCVGPRGAAEGRQ